MTAEELVNCLNENNVKQIQLANDLGVGRSAISKWVKGTSKISEPDAKLLRLYFYGEIPFKAKQENPSLKNCIQLSEMEWQVIGILAKRSGYESESKWITAKIREAIERHNVNEAQQRRMTQPHHLQAVAEEHTPYNAKIIDPEEHERNETKRDGGEHNTAG